MSYDYRTQRPKLFTETGTDLLLHVARQSAALLKIAGAVRAQEALAGASGDSWTMLAALDFLCEKGLLREVGADELLPGQDRVFVSGVPS